MPGLWRNRLVVVLLSGLGLGGCGLDAPAGGLMSPFGPACDPEPASQVPDEVWADARVVSIRIRQGDFSPMLIELDRNEPTVLRFSNGDAEDHSFRASEFFAAVSVASIREGESATPAPCPTVVDIPARGSAEIRLVPLRDGHFDYEDAWLPLLFSEGAAGTIIIR